MCVCVCVLPSMYACMCVCVFVQHRPSIPAPVDRKSASAWSYTL